MSETYWCTQCLQFKPCEDMKRNRRGKNGYASICKFCHNKKSKSYKAKRREAVWSVPLESTRTCHLCQRTKAIHEFERNVRCKGGYGHRCQVCCDQLKQERIIRTFQERLCEHCGERFMAPRSAIKKGMGKYCSKECSYSGLRKGHISVCEYCGKNFWVQPFYSAHGRKYCSRTCYGASMERRVTCTCQQCGKEFSVLPKQSQQMFCSWGCLHQHRREALPAEEIKRMYLDGNLAMPQIAKQFGVSVSSIQSRLEAMNIPRRNHSERIVSQTRFGNSLEMEMQRILDELGFAYKHSQKIEQRFFDFYLPDFNVLIECDGTFWHADPRFFPNRDNLYALQKKNIAADTKKNILAQERGYILLRFWEYDVWNNRDMVISQLQQLRRLTHAEHAHIRQCSQVDKRAQKLRAARMYQQLSWMEEGA